MILPEATITRLLSSIEAGRLVLLCGAGLSMPSPSNLMSAAAVAATCFDRYTPIQDLPADLRNDVAALAAHFYRQSPAVFDSVFISTLVPWNDLVGEPNPGHSAIGDLLVCRALQSALSANFDSLIEQCANRLKIAMRGALDGQEAAEFAKEVSPLVKFHGCLDRNREETLWTTLQLPEATIAKRVESCSQWMNLNLPGKDLLVVGFWSDWGYLNDVIANALDIQGFGSVTVVDPNSSANLKLKAPELWQRLSRTAAFEHLAGSGAKALEELRIAFSKVWLKRFYALGKALLEGEGLPYIPIDPTMSCDELYSCRRDAEGTPNNRAATMKAPAPQLAMAAFFHHLLRNAGSVREGPWHVLNGKRIRIVQGAGEALSTVKTRFKEPPALKESDFVVCAGSYDVACPSRIIASGVGKSVIRPGVGGEAIWMTLEQARTELGIDKPSAVTGTGGA